MEIPTLRELIERMERVIARRDHLIDKWLTAKRFGDLPQLCASQEEARRRLSAMRELDIRRRAIEERLEACGADSNSTRRARGTAEVFNLRQKQKKGSS